MQEICVAPSLSALRKLDLSACDGLGLLPDGACLTGLCELKLCSLYLSYAYRLPLRSVVVCVHGVSWLCATVACDSASARVSVLHGVGRRRGNVCVCAHARLCLCL